MRELLDQHAPRSKDPVAKQDGSEPEGSTAVRETIALDKPQTELSVAEKIALFRSLFRGREDVYAVRWEGANGKSGYSPASIKDWDALRLVPKSEWKKRDKETRQLLPLTDAALHNHLSGKITIGVYPLLADETCWFLAVDFDQQAWRQDATAGNGMFLPLWSGRPPVTEPIFGFSSRHRSPRCSQESWAPRC